MDLLLYTFIGNTSDAKDSEEERSESSHDSEPFVDDDELDQELAAWAATKIQTKVRGHLQRERYSRRRRLMLRRRRVSASSIIQAAMRGFLARQYLEGEQENESTRSGLSTLHEEQEDDIPNEDDEEEEEQDDEQGTEGRELVVAGGGEGNGANQQVQQGEGLTLSSAVIAGVSAVGRMMLTPISKSIASPRSFFPDNGQANLSEVAPGNILETKRRRKKTIKAKQH